MLPLATTVAPARPGPARSRATDPASLLAEWMTTAEPDDLRPRLLRFADGRLAELPVDRWTGPVDADDETLLQRVVGPVLDVGCGPGRLTAALHARGTDVLGLELLPDVPVLARRAGAPVHAGDVFDAVPRSGQWRTVLLADGNVGIGGDAVRLLRRVRSLLAPGGRVLCELHLDGDATGPVRLEGLGVASAWFPWAFVSRSTLPPAAASAGLRVEQTWRSAGRSFAALGTA